MTPIETLVCLVLVLQPEIAIIYVVLRMFGLRFGKIDDELENIRWNKIIAFAIGWLLLLCMLILVLTGINGPP